MRLDRATAKRIDRLARRAHLFHRYAHHPLCGRYAPEVIRIGRTRLCRGCTYAAAGGLAGGIAGLAIGAAPGVAAIATATAAALLVASLRLRPPKTVSRFVPAALLALAITCGALALHPVALAAAATFAGLVVLYKRRGPDRSPCTTCPERSFGPGRWSESIALHSGPCSGLAPIISRERAFQRVANQAIRRSAMSSGLGPRIDA